MKTSHNKQMACKQCGQSTDARAKSGLCRQCWIPTTYQVPHLPPKYLRLLINEYNQSQIARAYGVTSSTIRRWIEQMECEGY